MKQLFLNNTATTMFFSSDNTIEQIANWIESSFNSYSNPFNLVDRHSCRITEIVDNVIFISGDEDSIEILLEDIRPIDISQKYI